MKKSTKAALAGGAAVVLLLGGAGTLAFWSDSETIAGGSVNSGELALGAADCAETWTYTGGNEPVNLIVPGDSITKECTFDITATGDNLTADLVTPETVDVGSDPEAASLQATVDAEFAIAGNPIPAVITDDNDGQSVTATITVTFPFGTAEDASPPENVNDTQNLLITLDDIEVTLTQTES